MPLDYVRGLVEPASDELEVKALEKDICYVRIKSFGRRTGTHFRKAVEDLKGVKGLILDLRDNPGGRLQSALEVIENFVPEGKPLLIQAEKRGKKTYLSRGKDLINLPLAVLINASTASSAEIVAATLRHYSKAVIIGEKSLAKGTIQEVIPLGPKRTLVLTTGEYLLPDGSSIRGKGIIPDLVVKEADKQLDSAVTLLKGLRDGLSN